MSNFRDMPLDTALQKGDVVTITGPGEYDALVREVTDCGIGGDRVEINGMVGQYANLVVVLERDDRTLTRVQRPVPALPTVEGDYILTYADGARQVRTLTDGRWTSGRGLLIAMKADIQGPIESGATLTRVIPADEVKHPEVHVGTVCAEFQDIYLDSSKLAVEDFEDVLLRVLGGEFDL